MTLSIFARYSAALWEEVIVRVVSPQLEWIRLVSILTLFSALVRLLFLIFTAMSANQFSSTTFGLGFEEGGALQGQDGVRRAEL